MDFAAQLKSTVDIVAVVGEYVRLVKAGGQAFKGLCPFHHEKTPSFSVRPDKGFYCFGCQKGGSVIDFIMEIEGLTFWEACKNLAERYHIPIPKRQAGSDEETRRRAGIYEMHEIAQQMYRSSLQGPGGADARAYLAKRGVNQAMIEEFGLGLSERSGGLVRRLQQSGFGPEQLETSGLALARNDGYGFFDFFRGRLMFPIHNETGSLIGFAGRALEEGDEPKYLNSKETDIYRKSYVLYNLHRARMAARQFDHSILVEGYMDVIGLYGGGVQEVVASCGTALKATQVRILRRHADTIVVNFDPDPAGVKAAERSIEMLLEEGMRIRVLELPDGLDPDEFVLEHGSEAYRTRIARAPNYFHWLADRARQKFDFRSAEGRVDGFKFLLPSIQRLSDKLERAAVANDLASYLGVDASLVLEQFRKMAAERSQAKFQRPKLEVPATERLLLKCLIESAEARRAVLPKLERMDLRPGLVTANILRALVKLGEDFSHDSLSARLEDRDKALLAEAAFADEAGIDPRDENPSAPQALACLARMENDQRDANRAELKERIREAEKRGEMAEAMRLMTDLRDLGRS